MLTALLYIYYVCDIEHTYLSVKNPVFLCLNVIKVNSLQFV